MGEDAGSVFVVRNVANLVVNTDFNLMSALQYAVNVLQVEHIIVCGHYDCGGVRASVEKKDHSPPLENWLRNIRDVYV
jgi:carbonic anhydrase